MKEKTIYFPESDICQRIKNERVNRGTKLYKEYVAESYGLRRTRELLGVAKTLKI